jgi:hypothetical protein
MSNSVVIRIQTARVSNAAYEADDAPDGEGTQDKDTAVSKVCVVYV